jgi:hypothetical protein
MLTLRPTVGQFGIVSGPLIGGKLDPGKDTATMCLPGVIADAEQVFSHNMSLGDGVSLVVPRDST